MYKEKRQVEKPIIVIAGTVQEFEQYCTKNNLEEGDAIAVFQAGQLQFYPKDCKIVRTGTYWLNSVNDSEELKEREQGNINATVMQFGNSKAVSPDEETAVNRLLNSLKEMHNSSAMQFGSGEDGRQKSYKAVLEMIASGNITIESAIKLATQALGE